MNGPRLVVTAESIFAIYVFPWCVKVKLLAGVESLDLLQDKKNKDEKKNSNR